MAHPDLFTEGLIVRFIGDGEEFFVTSAVTIGDEIVIAAIRIEGKDAVYLFPSVAVLGEETACQTAFLDLYLRAEDGYLREERLYPVVDAGTDDDDIGSLCLRLLDGLDALGPQQLTIVGSKMLAEGIEGLQTHAFEEIGKDLLLCLPIRIEFQFHQHQQMGMTQETKHESLGATGIADKLQQGITGGQRPIEIEGIYFSHTGRIRLMIC